MCKHRFDELGIGPTKPLSSIQRSPKLELRQLSLNLRYTYLGEFSIFLVIISNSNNGVEEKRLFRVFRDNKTAIGWSITNIKGISPSLCMYKILIEENFWPITNGQRRLNPNMKESGDVEAFGCRYYLPISDNHRSAKFRFCQRMMVLHW